MENKKLVSTVVLTAMLSTSLPTIALAEEHLDGEMGSSQQITEQIIVPEAEGPVLAPVETPEPSAEEKEPVGDKESAEEKEPVEEEQPVQSLPGNESELPLGETATPSEDASIEDVKNINAPLMKQLAPLKDDLLDNAVQSAQQLLEALPAAEQVLLSHQETIVAAREAYNALDKEQAEQIAAELVSNLAAVEAAWQSLREVADALEHWGTSEMPSHLETRAVWGVYHALSAEQKASLTGGVQLEAAINAMAYQAPAADENIWATTTADLAPTTAGITAQIDEKTNKITYTIPEDFAGSIHINAVQDVLEALQGTYVPGESAPFSIEIINESEHTFQYVPGSFKVSTEDLTPYIEQGLTRQVGDAVGFDGSPIAWNYAVNRTANTAIQALYDVKSTGKISAEMLTNEQLGAKLIAKGYTEGIDDLAQYYLDFYNEAYGTDAQHLMDFEDKVLMKIFDGNRKDIGNNSPNTRVLVETNKEVAETGYNLFYNKALFVVPEGVKGAERNGYSVGAYMRGENEGYEAYCQEAFGDIQAGEAIYALQPFVMDLDFYYITNAYMNMDFGFFVVLDLEQTDEPELPPTPPTPVDPVDPPAPSAPVDPGDSGDYTPSEPYVPSQPTVIPEITVPLAELPEAPVVEAPAEVIIPEEAVPLAEIPTPVTDNPKTGQSGQGWLLSLLLMAAGALGLECKRKKA